MLNWLSAVLPSSTLHSDTLLDQSDLNFLLLNSSPSDNTELYKLNILLNLVFIKVLDLSSLVKQYIDWVTCMAEIQNAKLNLICK